MSPYGHRVSVRSRGMEVVSSFAEISACLIDLFEPLIFYTPVNVVRALFEQCFKVSFAAIIFQDPAFVPYLPK